ncbi:hypothetical protein ACTXMK_05420 [Psychrobacter celer]|uniref:hypothetical protein n=1 Tax=Psychrobacter celer TaxID=306572 RepID=UPI003FD42B65
MITNLPASSYEGFYKIRVLEGDTVKQEIDWQNNLITDAGLDMLGDSTIKFMSYLFVSTDNTEPLPSSNTMTGVLGRATGVLVENIRKFDEEDSTLYYIDSTYIYKYKGNENVNISKLHLSPSRSTVANVFSASLVKNAEGEAITISLRSVETLEVTYTVREYFRTNSVIESTISVVKNLGDGDILEEYDVRSVVYHPDWVPSGFGYDWSSAKSDVGITVYNGENSKTTAPYYSTSGLRLSGGNKFRTSSPIGSRGYNDGYTSTPHTVLTVNDYVQGSYGIDFKIVFTRYFGNNSEGIRTLIVVTNKGMFALEFTSKTTGLGIIKSSYDELTFNLRLNWGRYEPAAA